MLKQRDLHKQGVWHRRLKQLKVVAAVAVVNTVAVGSRDRVCLLGSMSVERMEEGEREGLMSAAC